MIKFLSFTASMVLGVLCVAPPEIINEPSHISQALGAFYPDIKMNYDIPLIVNSFLWMFLVVISSLLTFYAFSQKIHISLKAFFVYLLVIGCFFSQVPYISFNAFMVATASLYFYMGLKKCDFKIILDMLQAVFWLELTFAGLHYIGKDVLMNFGRTEPLFFGTVFQHMRFSSLLCILSPFVLMRSKWYIIPICLSVIFTASSGYGLAIIAGVACYLILDYLKNKKTNPLLSDSLRSNHVWLFMLIVLFAGVGIYHGRDSWAVALREGRLPVWLLIVKCWIFDTRVNPHGIPDIFGISQSGPFSLKCFLFGHGLDTFYPLFPAYKADPNPFPQAHNDWLQFLWELGLLGFSILAAFFGRLIKKLYDLGLNEEIAGCVIISVNMFFHFPVRITQTMFLLIAWVAFCEIRIHLRRL